MQKLALHREAATPWPLPLAADGDPLNPSKMCFYLQVSKHKSSFIHFIDIFFTQFLCLFQRFCSLLF
jgi:hypothetical protein